VLAPLPYTPIAGIVPCPRGWLVQPARLTGVTIVPEEPFVLPSLTEVVDYRPSFAVIALGAPVGFHDEPNGGWRKGDLDARRLLGWPRRTAVAPVPSRAALYAPTMEAAMLIEPWLTPLSYRRLRWLREIDEEIQPYHQRRLFSAVPELSFYLVNSDHPTRTSVYWRDGPDERLELLRERLPGLRAVALGSAPRGASLSHVIDAAGLLWTARRIKGKAITRLPEEPEWDSLGRRMEIVR
jgi:predicted RNase H-like nuclease